MEVGFPSFQSAPPRGRRPSTGPRSGGFDRFNPRLHAGGDGDSPAVRLEAVRFQSAPPRGRRPARRSRRRSRTRGFNPRLHAGGDSLATTSRKTSGCFNPRLHAGGDPCHTPIPLSPPSFNPRLHAGGDALPGIGRMSPQRFQSAPPRGRRPDHRQRWSVHRRVSIRASTREATHVFGERLSVVDVSIRASTREATASILNQFIGFPCFNPRLHAGGDVARLVVVGVTIGFQSAPPRGRRRVLIGGKVDRYAFQSAPPRGRRQPIRWVARLSLVFQSAPPRGRRRSRAHWHPDSGWFQSAPPRGRRRYDRKALLKNVNSGGVREPRSFPPREEE